MWWPHIRIWVGLLYLRLGPFYLCLVSVACGNWLGLFDLQLKFGLVFLLAYGGKLTWSFLLSGRPPTVRKLDLVFFTSGSPTVSKKDEPQERLDLSFSVFPVLQ